jgi:hypothetical protein
MSIEGLERWCHRHAGKIKESGGYNHTIIWEWFRRIYGYTLQGSSWCGATVCVELTWGAGWKPPADWTGVWAIEDWGRAHGRYHSGTSGIQLGDALILIGHGTHTGIARGKPRAGFVPTWEGNTSSGAYGSQNNGDGYYKRLRPAYQVVGYVRLHDLLAKAESPKSIPDFKLGTLPLKADGDRGPQTIGHIQKAIDDIRDGSWNHWTKKRLKRHLNKKLGLTGKAELSTKNGHFGRKATKALQKYVGVKQTGRWNRDTTKAIQHKLNAKKF